MSAFSRKVQVEQTSSTYHHQRNPRSPDDLAKWMRRSGRPVFDKIVSLHHEVKALFGLNAGLTLNGYWPVEGVEQWGGIRPGVVYFDLSGTTTGGRYGTGRSVFMWVANNKVFSSRFPEVFDADHPNSPGSRAFLDALEDEVARMFRGERLAARHIDLEDAR